MQWCHMVHVWHWTTCHDVCIRYQLRDLMKVKYPVNLNAPALYSWKTINASAYLPILLNAAAAMCAHVTCGEESLKLPRRAAMRSMSGGEQKLPDRKLSHREHFMKPFSNRFLLPVTLPVSVDYRPPVQLLGVKSCGFGPLE